MFGRPGQPFEQGLEWIVDWQRKPVPQTFAEAASIEVFGVSDVLWHVHQQFLSGEHPNPEKVTPLRPYVGNNGQTRFGT